LLSQTFRRKRSLSDIFFFFFFFKILKMMDSVRNKLKLIVTHHCQNFCLRYFCSEMNSRLSLHGLRGTFWLVEGNWTRRKMYSACAYKLCRKQACPITANVTALELYEFRWPDFRNSKTAKQFFFVLFLAVQFCVWITMEND
jgi:hypothetical protein